MMAERLSTMVDANWIQSHSVGNYVSEVWVVVSEPDELTEQEDWSNEFQCSVHGVFDREDAADNYAFQLSKQDGTRTYGALRCPTVCDKL